MKKSALIGFALALTLTACGKTTIIREVPVTTPSTSTSAPVPSDAMTTSEAIMDARETAPSLNQFTDTQIFEFMTTVCDTIDDWAPDYSGYLVNVRNKLSEESMQSKVEITALIIAAINSVCTWHEDGINAVLGV